MFDIKKISSHFWLKQESSDSFHAYLNIHDYAVPLCKEDLPLNDFGNVSLPGDLSPCCNKCSFVLFQFPRPIVIKSVKNELNNSY